MFYCDGAPEKGGQTILCDGLELLQELLQALQSELIDLKIRWHINAPEERWSTVLQASSETEAAERIEQLKLILKPWERKID